jgi:hypothetical protein
MPYGVRLYGDTWAPDHARPEQGVPQVGWLVGYEHRVWRVLKVTPWPRDKWTDEDRERVAARGVKAAPVNVWMRPDDVEVPADPVAARRLERSFSARPFLTRWWVMRDEHYPVCQRCGEPPPCREVWAGAVASRHMQELARFETSGVCPACAEPISARQKSITFSENLRIPGGPPVTYHRRGRCFWGALTYEKEWVAADPGRRRVELSCPGVVTNHGDGTYECTEGAGCRGRDANHEGYQACGCRSCHVHGHFGCYPKRGAVRRGG